MAGKLKSVLDILNERAVDADNWDEFADLWLNEWEQALADGKAELISTAGAILRPGLPWHPHQGQ